MHQRRDRESDGLGGHLCQRRKTAIMHLLLPARLIELHDFHEPVVLEVGDWRIVECQVAVFTNAQAAQVFRTSSVVWNNRRPIREPVRT